MIIKVFNEIITKFPIESEKEFKNNQFARKMRNELTNEIQNSLNEIINDNYSIKINPGVSNWFFNPRIEIINKFFSMPELHLGIYYFFDFKNNSINLILAHNWTKNNIRKKEAIQTWINKIINKKFFKPLTFNEYSPKRENKDKKWINIDEMTIFSKQYIFSKLDEEEIMKDLKNLIENYEKLIPEYRNFLNKIINHNLEIDLENELLFKQKNNEFFNLTQYELKLIKKIGGDSYNKLYISYYDELEEHLKNINFIDLLSALFILNRTDIDYEKSYCNQTFKQYQIYLIQALCLRNKTFKNRKLTKKQLKRILYLINTIPEFLFLKEMFREVNLIKQDYEIEKTLKKEFISEIKRDTMTRTGTIPVYMIKEINTELYKPLDYSIYKEMKIKIINIIKMFENIINHNIESLSENIAFSKIEYNLENKRSIDYIKIEELINQNYLILSLKNLKQYYPEKIKEKNLKEIMNKISLSPGELKETNRNWIFFDNPILTKPFIKISEQSYFLPNPQIIMDNLDKILFNIIKENKKIKKQFNNRKSKYLEDKTAKLFENNLKNGEVYKNLKFIDESGEIDVLILIDSYALIIECKSHNYSNASKRGATSSLKRDLKNLVVKPSHQSNKSKEKINPKLIKFKKEKEIISIDFSNIKEILQFNVNLDYIGDISSKSSLLTENILEKYNEEEIYPSIYIGDLKIILELLETDAQIIHYFSRRKDLNRNIDYRGDELDLFTLYLLTTFNTDFSLKGFNIDLRNSYGEYLRPYYIIKGVEQEGFEWPLLYTKPSIKLTKLWKSILKKLEDEKKDNWLEISINLLNIPYEDQKIINENCKNLEKELTENNNPIIPINFTVCMETDENLNKPLIIFKFKELSLIEQKIYLNLLLESIFNKNEEFDEYIVMGMDVETDSIYEFIKIINKKDVKFYLDIQELLDINIYDIYEPYY